MAWKPEDRPEAGCMFNWVLFHFLKEEGRGDREVEEREFQRYLNEGMGILEDWESGEEGVAGEVGGENEEGV